VDCPDSQNWRNLIESHDGHNIRSPSPSLTVWSFFRSGHTPPGSPSQRGILVVDEIAVNEKLRDSYCAPHYTLHMMENINKEITLLKLIKIQFIIVFAAVYCTP